MFRIFGPPGCGKTTTLLNMVDKCLSEGIAPNEIGFFAFSRKAAREARERAAERFQLDPDSDLVYFRTLHSFAYRMLGLRDNQLMKTEHYRELSSLIGINLTTVKVLGNLMSDEELSNSITDHPILSLINLARLKKTELRREYDHSALTQTWAEVSYVDRSYTKYKEANALCDYTDMLRLFAEGAIEICPTFKVAFMDEAQDLCALQWDIAHAIEAKSEKMYCAGDDDQAIFKWAGADPSRLINLEGGSETLSQSYRIPAKVHYIAEKVVHRINNRFPKKYLPRKEKGTVQHIFSPRELDMSEGTWLILAQARYMLYPVEEDLKSAGYLFEKLNGYRSIPEKLSQAVNGWEQLRKGESVPLATAQRIYSYMTGNGVKIARGFKKINGEEEDVFNLAQLQRDFGLLVGEELVWHEAMDKLPQADRAYIVALLRRGEKFNAKPRIKVSTIHQAKGGEAENVVLHTDLSAAAARVQDDDTHRVFYVGVTRTRNNLFIVEPEDSGRSYLL
tara:strand:- start:809 stop:2326 length:1518 start_codon:yes stop_codon:yes gene_type:complete